MAEDVEEAEIRTPSTLGNFGPGFDATALALDWGGDTVRVAPAGEDGLTVEGPHRDGVPEDWDRNCASVAVDHLRDAAGIEVRVHLTVTKGTPPASGLGSSASSSAGAALALARATRRDVRWTRSDLLAAARAGEAAVAGAHGDDVAAALLGGLAVVRGDAIRRIEPPTDLHVGLAVPALEAPTREMREAVPDRVPVADAAANLANVALLVDAVHRGDVEGVGRALDDRIAAPRRAERLPHVPAALEAARRAGAAGAALAGSGPSVFAVASTREAARAAAEAMREAAEDAGLEARAAVAEPERRRVLEDALDREDPP